MKIEHKKLKSITFITSLLFVCLLSVYGCSSSGDDATSTNQPTSTNNPPTASNSTITVDEDSSVTGTMTASDADGDAISFSIVTEPNLGTVTVTDVSTGAFTYTPNSNESGNDSFTFNVSDGEEDSNTAVVSITITPANDGPSASVPADFSADELSTVNLIGSGSGQGITYNWTQTAGPVQVVLMDADTSSAWFKAPVVETVASLPLTFKLTVTDSGSLTAEETVDVTISPVGHIVGSVSAGAYHTNLPQEGTLDWAAWGYLTNASFTSKNGGAAWFGSADFLTEIPTSGAVTRARSTGNPVAFSWDDGLPAPAHEETYETRTRIRITDADAGEGIRLSIPAGVEDRILKVHLGTYQNKGKVTVRLVGDSSATPYTISLDNPDAVQEAWTVMIHFGAANDGATLQFDYEVEEDYGGHINIAAATLTTVPATPTFSPLPGTYTDPLSVTLSSTPSSADFRYTTNGSQPDENSTLYSGGVSLTQNTTLNARAYSGQAVSSVASGLYFIDTSAAGTIAANVAPAPYHTNLTTEGTRDWAAWGLLTNDSFTSKSAGTNELSDFSDYPSPGDVTPVRSTGNPVYFSWDDGVPAPAHEDAVRTGTRVLFSDASTDQNEGIQLTIPANSVEKTLKVYLGAYSMQGVVTVFMENGSVPVYTTAVSSPDEAQKAWVVTVDFASPSATNLIFRYTRGLDQGDVAGGHINIAAASLSD